MPFRSPEIGFLPLLVEGPKPGPVPAWALLLTAVRDRRDCRSVCNHHNPRCSSILDMLTDQSFEAVYLTGPGSHSSAHRARACRRFPGQCIARRYACLASTVSPAWRYVYPSPHSFPAMALATCSR